MDDKPKTLFALKVSRDKRFLQDMWYMFILFSILAAAAIIVSLIQYAFCNSLYPDMGFKDCMVQNLFERKR